MQYFKPGVVSSLLFKTKINIDRDKNQARELATYAINFLNTNQYIAESVYDKAKLFHTDAAL